MFYTTLAPGPTLEPASLLSGRIPRACVRGAHRGRERHENRGPDQARGEKPEQPETARSTGKLLPDEATGRERHREGARPKTAT